MGVDHQGITGGIDGRIIILENDPGIGCCLTVGRRRLSDHLGDPPAGSRHFEDVIDACLIPPAESDEGFGSDSSGNAKE